MNQSRLDDDYAAMDRAREQKKAEEEEREERYKRQLSFRESLIKLKKVLYNRKARLKAIEGAMRDAGINLQDDDTATWAQSDYLYTKSRVLAYTLDMKRLVGEALGGFDSDGWGTKRNADGTRTNVAAAEVFGEYLALNRQATERKDIANKYSKAEAEALLEEIRTSIGDEKFNRLKEAKEAFNKIREEYIIPAIEQSGAFSQAVVDKAKSNKDYATFQVVFDKKDAGQTGAFTVKPVGIHAQKGTLLDIGNAFTATVENDIALTKFIAQNNFKLKATDILKSSAAASMGYTITAAKKDSRGNFIDVGSGGSMNTVYVLEGGKMYAYNMDKELAETVRDPSPQTNWFLKALTVWDKFWKPLVTTLSPTFQIPNIIRDHATTLFNAPEALRKQYIRSYYNALKEAFRYHGWGEMSGDVREILKHGGLNTGYTYSRDGDMGIEDLQKRMAGAFASGNNTAMRNLSRRAWDTVAMSAKAVYHGAETLSGTLETASKLAAYKTLTGVQGVSAKDAARITRKKVGTPDPLEGGTITAYTNKIFLFSNMQIQGLRQSIAVARENPKRSLSMWALYNALPMLPALLAQHGLLSQLGELLGEDDDGWLQGLEEMYNKIPTWDKVLRTALPIPIQTAPKMNKNGSVIAGSERQFYFVLPQSEVAQLVNAVTYHILDGMLAAFRKDVDKGKVAGNKVGAVTGEMLGSLLPYSAAGQLPALQVIQAWGSFLQGNDPIDFHKYEAGNYDRIVGRDNKGLHNIKGWGDMGLWSLNKLGLGVIWQIKKDTFDFSDKHWFEIALGMPLGPALGRFVRVSNKGIDERERAEKSWARD